MMQQNPYPWQHNSMAMPLDPRHPYPTSIAPPAPAPDNGYKIAITVLGSVGFLFWGIVIGVTLNYGFEVRHYISPFVNAAVLVILNFGYIISTSRIIYNVYSDTFPSPIQLRDLQLDVSWFTSLTIGGFAQCCGLTGWFASYHYWGDSEYDYFENSAKISNFALSLVVLWNIAIVALAGTYLRKWNKVLASNNFVDSNASLGLTATNAMPSVIQQQAPLVFPQQACLIQHQTPSAIQQQVSSISQRVPFAIHPNNAPSAIIQQVPSVIQQGSFAIHRQTPASSMQQMPTNLQPDPAVIQKQMSANTMQHKHPFLVPHQMIVPSAYQQQDSSSAIQQGEPSGIQQSVTSTTEENDPSAIQENVHPSESQEQQQHRVTTDELSEKSVDASLSSFNISNPSLLRETSDGMELPLLISEQQ